MTQTISPPASSQVALRTIAWAAVVMFVSSVTPARAQMEAQFDIVGHVAPRCWVSNAARPSQPGAPGGAICNQARPALQSRVRVLAISEQLQPVEDRLPSSTALEIIVSPQL